MIRHVHYHWSPLVGPGEMLPERSYGGAHVRSSSERDGATAEHTPPALPLPAPLVAHTPAGLQSSA